MRIALVLCLSALLIGCGESNQPRAVPVPGNAKGTHPQPHSEGGPEPTVAPRAGDLMGAMQALSAKNIRIKLAAIQVLADIGDPAHVAINELIDATKSGTVALRNAAANAIKKIGARQPSMVVEFGAEWCPPCRRMKPVVLKLESEGLPIAMIDSDENSKLTEQLKVEFLPTFLLIVDGVEKDRIVGGADEKTLRRLLSRVPKPTDDPLFEKKLEPRESRVMARVLSVILSLEDDNAWTRHNAEAALSRAEGALVPVLFEVMNNKETPRRIQRAVVLALTRVRSKEHDDRVRRVLTRTLKESEAPLNILAPVAIALRQRFDFREELAVDVLRETVAKTKVERIRVAAANELTRLPDRNNLKAFVAGLKSNSAPVRAACARGIASLGVDGESAISDLLADFVENSTAASEDALRSICAESVTAANHLAGPLTEGNADVRDLALRILRDAEFPKPAAAALVKLLNDPESEVRLTSALVLHQIGGFEEQIAPALIAALATDDYSDAFDALVEIGATSASRLADVVLSEKANIDQRYRAAMLLRQSNDPKIQKRLAAGLGTGNRLYAAVALGPRAEFAAQQNAAFLVAIEKTNGRFRQLIIESIQPVAGDRKPIDKLIPLLEKKAEPHRMSVATALSRQKLSGDELKRVGILLDEREMFRAALVVLQFDRPAKTVAPLLIESLGKAQPTRRRLIQSAIQSLKKPAIPYLVKELRAENTNAAELRLWLETIGGFRHAASDSATTVSGFLSHRDETVRVEAAIALSKIKPDAAESVSALLAGLRLKDRAQSRRARYALIEMEQHAQAAIDPLIKMLQSDQSEARETALSILPQIAPKSPQSLAALVACLKNSEPASLRIAAVRGLGLSGGAAVPQLTKSLEDDQTSRGDVLDALTLIGTAAQPAAASIRALLKDKKLAARAARALAKIDPTDHAGIPVLIGHYKSADPQAKTQAVEAMAGLREAPDVIPTLIDALRHKHTRVNAIAAIGRQGEAAAKAIPALKQMLLSRAYAEDVLQALRNLGPVAKPAQHDVLDLMKFDRHCFSAASTLVAIKPDAEVARKAVVNLLERLKGAPGSHRLLFALGFLGRVAPKQAVENLTQAADRATRRTQEAAFTALAYTQSKEAANYLVGRLKKGDQRTRNAVIEALSEMKEHAAPAAPALIALLDQTSEGRATRILAVRALGDIGEPAAAAMPKLIALLEEKTMRDSAISAIGSMGKAAGPAIPRLISLLKDEIACYNASYQLSRLASHAKPHLAKIREVEQSAKSRRIRNAARTVIRAINNASR